MEITTVLTVHGINTFGQSFGDELAKSLIDLKNVRVRSIYWGSLVKPMIDDSRQRYRRPAVPWWRLWSRTKRAFVDYAQQSMEYSLLYLSPDIRARVIETIKQQVEQEIEAETSRFVIVGHSLGTVAVHDAVFHIQATTDLLTPPRLHHLVTMGSPISIFPHTTPKALKFSGRWLNLMDVEDAIARPIGPDDDRVEDIEIETGGLISAHEGYWKDSKVHQIIRKLVTNG